MNGREYCPIQKHFAVWRLGKRGVEGCRGVSRGVEGGRGEEGCRGEEAWEV